METRNIENIEKWKYGKMEVWKKGNLVKSSFGNIKYAKHENRQKWKLG